MVYGPILPSVPTFGELMSSRFAKGEDEQFAQDMKSYEAPLLGTEFDKTGLLFLTCFCNGVGRVSGIGVMEKSA